MSEAERLVWAAAFAKWTAQENYGGFFGHKIEEHAVTAARVAYNAVLALRVANATLAQTPSDDEAIAMAKEFAAWPSQEYRDRYLVGLRDKIADLESQLDDERAAGACAFPHGNLERLTVQLAEKQQQIERQAERIGELGRERDAALEQLKAASR